MGPDTRFEQRWGPRRAAAVVVTVYHQGQTMGQYSTRNIGREGMFVETNGVTFPVQTMIEVSFKDPVLVHRVRQRVPSLVVHRATDGVGLMFCSFDHRLFEALDRFVQAVCQDDTPRPRKAG